jgi:hypothetical protein
VVYGWLEGVTLNQCRREAAAPVLLGLAEPLARLAASVATWSPACVLPSRTTAADQERGPMHGDFGGRNIIGEAVVQSEEAS